jgi:uncharacterized protein
MAGIGWRHSHYAELLQRACSLQDPGLDFIEVHSENFFARGGAALAVLRQGREQFPVSLHGVGLSLGSATGIERWHLQQLALLVGQIEPIRVSDHACFARGSLGPNQPIHAADLLPIPFSQEALDVLVANVQHVQDVLKRPIAVENLSAYIAWNADQDAAPLSEPAFLNALVSRSGCQLLVDVNNIYVNALNGLRLSRPALGQVEVAANALQHCFDWLDQIAPASVAEIHLAGHHVGTDMVIDDHGSQVCDAVWQVYSHASARFGKVPTLVEWDTDIPPLDVLLGEAARADTMQVLATALHHRLPV